MSHLDEGRLHELLDGELDAGSRAAALAHLAGCERCRVAYEEAKSFLAEADGLIEAVQVVGVASESRVASRESQVAGESEVASRESQVESAASPSGSGLSTDGMRSRRRLSTYRTLAWAASLVVAVGLGWYGSTLSRRAPEALKSEASRVTVAADQAVAPMATEQPVDVAPPAAASPPALARADRAPLRQAPAAPVTITAPPIAEEKAGADEVLAAAANQAPMPAPEPVTTASGAAASGIAARKIAPVQEQLAPQAAYTALESGARQKERDASRPAEGGRFSSPTSLRASRSGAPAMRPIAMEEAVRILGGSIRLIDGLTPTGILGVPGADKDGTSRVRVVYEDPPGRELWLEQQRLVSVADTRVEATALLPGDTTEVAGQAGARSLHWVDQTGFQLALTGFLPADSLRQFLRRVQ